MATRTVRQSRFTMGEVDEINWKRTDFEDYLSAAQSLLNAEIGTTGLAKKRPGTKALLDVGRYATPNSKIYEFSDNFSNYYLILSAPNFMHIFAINGDELDFYQSVETSYDAETLLLLDYTEQSDSIVFTTGAYEPSRLYIESYDPAVFVFEELNIFPFPAYDFGNINYDNFTAELSGDTTTATFKFTGLTSDPGYTEDWVGGQIIGGGEIAEQPIGYGIITAVVPFNGTEVSFTLDVRVPFKIPGSTKGSEYSVRQPSWSDTLGWPKKVSNYQNRFWYGNTEALPTSLFGSQINKPVNFDVGTGEDTEAIIYSLGQSNTGGITWINPGKQLEVYTLNFEFVAPQDVNTALTPETFTIRQQDAYGSSPAFKPINYTNDSYYSNRTGKSFINYRFDGVGQAYTSTNISIASGHLIKQPKNRALIRGTDSSQDNFVYLLNSDNTITAFQFAMQGGLAAFTPFVFEEDEDGNSIINTLDIFTINNEVYLLKYYVLSEKYAIEKLQQEYKIDSYLDLTMSIDGEVLGLQLLEGYTVSVLFDSQDYGQYLVQNGKINVFNPNQDSGVVQVGLIYPFEIRTMYIYAGSNKSNWEKHLTEINIDYYQSLDFYINGKLVPYQTFSNTQQQLPPVPQTGTAVYYPVRGWNRFDTVTITQNAPFDIQILAIDYQVSAQIVS